MIYIALTIAAWAEFLVYAVIAVFLKKAVIYALVAFDLLATVLFTFLIWLIKPFLEVYF